MGIHDRINGCIAIEQAAADIYSAFMGLFPEEKGFWEGLYNDEIDHAALLSEADYLDVFTKLPTRTELPSMLSIENTLEYAQDMSMQIKLSPVSLEGALNIALKLEESIVETFSNELTSDLMAEDDDSFIMDFGKILIDERGHVSRIKDMMIKKSFLKLS